MEWVDLLVVGAGPAGLSVAAECLYHGLGTVHVLEKGATHNQTVLLYYPDDKRVDASYKGQEAICAGVLCFRDTTKPHFMEIADQMIQDGRIPITYDCHVDSVKKQPDSTFLVSCSNGKMFRSRYVVLAVGRMGRPNRPDYFSQIPPSVRTRVHFDLRQWDPVAKKLLVVGGGNSAIEFALSLAQKGDVTVSYRQPKFHRLNPMNLKLLEEDFASGRIRPLLESNITAISENEGKPLVHFQDGSKESFDHVVFGIGGSSPAAFLQGAGIELDARGNPILSSHLESSVPGLFVVGELSVPPGKGSIIMSFNSGKKMVEDLMNRLGRERMPELVRLA